jgi:hypothetical protein
MSYLPGFPGPQSQKSFFDKEEIIFIFFVHNIHVSYSTLSAPWIYVRSRPNFFLHILHSPLFKMLRTPF